MILIIFVLFDFRLFLSGFLCYAVKDLFSLHSFYSSFVLNFTVFQRWFFLNKFARWMEFAALLVLWFSCYDSVHLFWCVLKGKGKLDGKVFSGQSSRSKILIIRLLDLVQWLWLNLDWSKILLFSGFIGFLKQAGSYHYKQEIQA